MVDQRAHAIFVPFVTWSTNPQYLLFPWRTSWKSYQLLAKETISYALLDLEKRTPICEAFVTVLNVAESDLFFSALSLEGFVHVRSSKLWARGTLMTPSQDG